MKICTTLFAFLFAVISYAQSDTLSNNNSFKFEIEASIDRDVWRQHLSDKMPPIMDSATKRKIPNGTYTVQVKFLVETDGSISNVQAMNNPGFGLAEGAVKIVETSPRWDAGIQNGKKIRTYRTQPITFIFNSESTDKNNKSNSQNKDREYGDMIFVKSEIEPSIDFYVWHRHQEKQIKKFLKASKGKQKIPAGTYSIKVVFLVEKNGTISDVQIPNDPGFGLAELAKTICRTSPKWIPGKQNSYNVRAYKTDYIELTVID